MASTKSKSFHISKVNQSAVKIGSLSSGQYKNASFSYNDGPLIVTLNKGGNIHRDFGVAKSTYGGNGINIRLSLDDEEYKHIAELHEHVLETILKERSKYFPNNSEHPDNFIKAMANKTVHPPNPKKEGGGDWPPAIMIKIDKESDTMPDDNNKRRCKIKNTSDGSYIDDIYAIKGYNWTKAKLELKGVYFQSGKLAYGIVKRLRYLEVSPNHVDLEVDSDSEEETPLPKEEEGEPPRKRFKEEE